jgi:hypothetical protein
LQTDDEGIVKIKIRGLTSDGYLEATNIESTKLYELYPDGNSFDMLHNLIKKKN